MSQNLKTTIRIGQLARNTENDWICERRQIMKNFLRHFRVNSPNDTVLEKRRAAAKIEPQGTYFLQPARPFLEVRDQNLIDSHSLTVIVSLEQPAPHRPQA